MEDEKQPSQSPSQVNSINQGNGPNFCKQCGSQIASGAKFCKNCGADRNSIPTPSQVQSDGATPPVPHYSNGPKGNKSKLPMIGAIAIVALLLSVGVYAALVSSNTSGNQDNTNPVNPTISITNINPTNVKTGDGVEIKWTCSDSTKVGIYVKISYVPMNSGAGAQSTTIVSQTENDGSYTWVIPSTLDVGTQITIHISSLDSKITGSSNTLTIASTPTNSVWVELNVPSTAWTDDWGNAVYSKVSFSATIHGATASQISDAVWNFGNTRTKTIFGFQLTSTTLPEAETHYVKPGTYAVSLEITLKNQQVISNTTTIVASYPEQVTINSFRLANDPYMVNWRCYQVQFTIKNVASTMIELDQFPDFVYEGGVTSVMFDSKIPPLLAPGESIEITGRTAYVYDPSQPIQKPIQMMYGYNGYMYLDLNDEPSQSSWVTSTVYPSTAGLYSDLALDSNGNVYLSSISGSGSYRATFSSNVGGSWSNILWNTDGSYYAYHDSYPTIAVNSLGRAFICYVSETSGGSVVVSKQNQGSTVSLAVVSTYLTDDSDVCPAMAISNDGQIVHVAYVDNDQLIYKRVTFSSDTQYAVSGSTIVTGSTNSIGKQISMVVDGNGYVHISYYGAINGDLKYATNTGGSWSTSTIDSSGNVGQQSSIAVDSSGTVHVAYSDGYPNYDLKYASKTTSGQWVIETVDAGGNVGAWPSLYLQSNKVYISYFDATNYDVKCAIKSGGSWTTQKVADVTSGNVKSSIAVGTSGKIFVAYCDNGALKLSTLG